MSDFYNEQGYTVVHCCDCGVAFGLNDTFYRRRKNDHKLFYCPAGHSQYFSGKSEADKLKEKLAQEQDARRAAQQKTAMLQQQNTRLSRSYVRVRERIKNGVCPCCNRTFQNLLKHMQSKHPDFSSEKQLRVIRQSYGLTQSDLAGEIGIQAGYISMYENNKPSLPAYAKTMIDTWLSAEAMV